MSASQPYRVDSYSKRFLTVGLGESFVKDVAKPTKLQCDGHQRCCPTELDLLFVWTALVYLWVSKLSSNSQCRSTHLPS